MPTRLNRRRRFRLWIFASAFALSAIGFILVSTEIGSAQNAAAAGTISGTVTADRGEVRALRVRAADTVHKITYTVFTNKGRYQIFNLPASSYDVSIIEDNFDAPVQHVGVRAGQTATANLALKAKAVQAQAFNVAEAARGDDANPNANALAARGGPVTLVDYDQLYPPGPGRDLLVANCLGCHGPAGWHNRGGKTEEGWRQSVIKMMTWQGVPRGNAPPWVTPKKFTDAERETMIKYLAANFPPNHPRRDWKLDTLVRDEDALAQAIYIRWELPPAVGPNFVNSGKPRRNPAEQAFPSPSRPGMLWAADMGASAVLLIDPRDLNYETRMKEYKISHPANLNAAPHGVIEAPNGLVYWTEYGPPENNIGELDTKTGVMHRYSAPTTCCSGSHTLRADSKSNIWWTMIYGESKIGKFDAVTKKITEFEPIVGGNWYGILVDKQDRVWAAGTGTPNLVMYDQKTEKWTKYPTTHGNRRVALDSKGNIWASQYFGNGVAMVDVATGKVTEYRQPLKYGTVYDVRPDADDNIWAENAIYNSLVRLDRTTNKWTYFPYPMERQHTPKLELGPDGTIWFGLSGQLTAFKARGNAPAQRASRD